ncbi:RICIN domain-containing protein [Catenuloplanes sp. NPDC051500]|uniref:RICIN domain-containing protein n=1 Tax=Catenuloplanes sp. NPDC051500 TaxID=3363959 RepID=UPI0037B75E6C
MSSHRELPKRRTATTRSPVRDLPVSTASTSARHRRAGEPEPEQTGLASRLDLARRWDQARRVITSITSRSGTTPQASSDPLPPSAVRREGARRRVQELPAWASRTQLMRVQAIRRDRGGRQTVPAPAEAPVSRSAKRHGQVVRRTSAARDLPGTVRLPRRLNLASAAVLVGVVLLILPALFTKWTPGLASLPGLVPIAALPASEPEDGLVYDGLIPASRNSVCIGAYEVKGGKDVCSYGPDPAPPSFKVTQDVAPIAEGVPPMVEPVRYTGSVPDDADVVRDEGAVVPASSMPALVPDPASGDAAFTLGEDGVACEGDGYQGKRVQIIYAYPTDAVSRYSRYLPSIRQWAAEVDEIFSASAARTGGVRHVRYVTTPDCRVDVTEVQIPSDRFTSFDVSLEAMRQLGYDRTDRKYLIFADTNVYCGIATFVKDARGDGGNLNNGGPSYARVDAGCWSAPMATHQLVHTLGGVADGAPNGSGIGHCLDDHDLMCYSDESREELRIECDSPSGEALLDCGGDDYFNTDPSPGSYLADNWNVADSEFLIREATPTPAPGTGGDSGAAPGTTAPRGNPSPSPGRSTTPPSQTPKPTPASPTPTSGEDDPEDPEDPEDVGDDDDKGLVGGLLGNLLGGGGGGAPVPPSPSATPSAAPPPSPAPSLSPPPPDKDSGLASEPPVGAPPPPGFLKIRDTTSTSTRVSWNPASNAVHYTVTVNGQIIGVTAATRARIIGLRPDTQYSIQVLVNDGEKFTDALAAKTAPAARPIMEGWFQLNNALTGGAAHLYGARTNEFTPIVVQRAEGVTQQQWSLRRVGNSFQLVSRATEKCVIPLGGEIAAGVPLVQVTCKETAVEQHWVVLPTEHGFTLRAAGADLVIGLGEQRYGGTRVLALQSPKDQLHQSWTALPG